MCSENKNDVLNLLFDSVSDEFNWQSTLASSVVTASDDLVFSAFDGNSTFTRELGQIDTNNNRIRLQSRLTVEKGTPGFDKTNIEMTIKDSNGDVVGVACGVFDEVSDGAKYVYFIDRTFKYTNNVGVATLELKIPLGFENVVKLQSLKVEDFNYCTDKIRSYFVLDGFLKESFLSKSSAFKLTQYRIDDVETLTQDFFNENNVIVGGPTQIAWNYGRANLDGSEREFEAQKINVFNPFVSSLGLNYDINTYFGGLPLGVASGSDYGQGILNLGFDKPYVLNGNLESKDGVFFIDIDYTKNLKINFEIAVNDVSTNVYDTTEPRYIREYTIEWNAITCESKFYYIEKNQQVEQSHNGFLYGIAPILFESNALGCDQTFTPTGGQGDYEFMMNFGTETGLVGIEYDSYSVPDRFVIEWNGQIFDTGFVGSNSYDSQLINAGVSASDINTSSPSNGSGTIMFNKTTAFPTQAKIKVLAPLGSTGWRVKGICSSVNSLGKKIQIGEGDCSIIPTMFDEVYLNVVDLNGYIPTNGDIVYTDQNLQFPYNGSDKFYRMKFLSLTADVKNYVFKVSSAGVISDVSKCISLASDPKIINIASTSANCDDGDKQTFTITGSPNQVVKYNLAVTNTSPQSHGALGTVESDTGHQIGFAALTVGSIQDDIITLDANGQAQVEIELCARPCLKPVDNTAIFSIINSVDVKFELYDNSQTLLSGEFINLNAFSQCDDILTPI